MKALLQSTKLFWGFMAFTSMMVLAGTIKDLRLYSAADFMNGESFQFIKRLDSVPNIIRNVASSNKDKPKPFHAPFNEHYINRIYGEWKIFKYESALEEEIKLSFLANFEMVGYGEIKIDTDGVDILDEQGKPIFKRGAVWNIGWLSDANTIGLYRKVKDGFEFLEAVKTSTSVVKNRYVSPVKVVSSKERRDGYVSGQKSAEREREEATEQNKYQDEELVLVLDTAFNKSKFRSIIKGEEFLLGHADVRKTSKNTYVINALEINVKYPNSDEEHVIRMDLVDVKAGGAFVFQNEEGSTTHGLFLKNGTLGYDLIITSEGTHAQTRFSFMTEDNIQKRLEEEQKRNELAREKAFERGEFVEDDLTPEQREDAGQQEQMGHERGGRMDYDGMYDGEGEGEEGFEMSDEEREELVSESGFHYPNNNM